MLLFEASQVNNKPLSERPSVSNRTDDVTVEPDETSDEVGNGIPLWNHLTTGFGRPEMISIHLASNLQSIEITLQGRIIILCITLYV